MAGKTGGKYAKYILEYDPLMEQKIMLFRGSKDLGIKPPMEILCV